MYLNLHCTCIFLICVTYAENICALVLKVLSILSFYFRFINFNIKVCVNKELHI